MSSVVSIFSVVVSIIAVVEFISKQIRELRTRADDKRCFLSIVNEIGQQYIRMKAVGEEIDKARRHFNPKGTTVRKKDSATIHRQIWILKKSRNWVSLPLRSRDVYKDLLNQCTNKQFRLCPESKRISIRRLNLWIFETEKILSDCIAIQEQIKGKISVSDIFSGDSSTAQHYINLIKQTASPENFIDELSPSAVINWRKITRIYYTLNSDVIEYIKCREKLNARIATFCLEYNIDRRYFDQQTNFFQGRLSEYWPFHEPCNTYF